MVIFSLIVAILCALMSPITLVCSIPAVCFAAMVSHKETLLDALLYVAIDYKGIL